LAEIFRRGFGKKGTEEEIMGIIFITGIDTGIGKTYVTGLLGRALQEQGMRVITSKIVQTGTRGPSPDLRLHRTIMGQEWTKWDEEGITCPYCFRFPGSPHLAADRENQRINPEVIDAATAKLSRNFDVVLMEGVGGINVPLYAQYTIMNFISERKYPCLVVSSSRLGSINHTLLTLEALHARRITVNALFYNRFISVAPALAKDTRQVFERFFPRLPVIDIPKFDPHAQEIKIPTELQDFSRRFSRKPKA